VKEVKHTPFDVGWVSSSEGGYTQKICSTCGTVAKPKKHTGGSFLSELVLWGIFLFLSAFFLPLILAPIIYTLWRQSTQKKVCPSCNAPNMISLDSPLGCKLQEQYDTDIEKDNVGVPFEVLQNPQRQKEDNSV